MPRSIFGFAIRYSGRHQLWLAVLTISIALLEMVPLEFQRRIVNESLEKAQLRPLLLLGAGYVGVNLLEGVLKLGLNFYRGWVGETAVRTLRQRLHRVVLRAPLGADAPEAEEGARVSVAVSEVEPVGAFVGSCFAEPLLQLGTLAAVFGYLAHLDLWMSLGGVGLFALQLLFIPLLQHRINQLAALRIATVRAMGQKLMNEMRMERPVDDHLYGRRVDQAFRYNLRIYWAKYLMNFLMNILYHFSVAGTFLVGGWLAINGRLEYGAVVAFASGLARVNDPWGDLVNYFRETTNTQVKYALIRGVLKPAGTHDGQPGGVAAPPGTGAIATEARPATD
jgi:ABC-type multidrug transport system fused ATPase/permease subunit